MPSSAGLLLYRVRDGQPQVLLVHPGGPFFARKDDGVWTIPKGLPDDGEDLLACARREFREETGFQPPVDVEYVSLGAVKQKGGKTVHAWAAQGDCDPALLKSNTFEMPWPPRSGKVGAFPEVDRAAWFGMDEARRKINPAQQELLGRLVDALSKG